MKAEPAFTRNLQTVTAKILAAGDMDEILRETSQDICAIFAADRLTIYLVNEDKTLIVSKIKTGLDSYEDLKLPFSLEYSIAGYVALNRRAVNIKDVYDIQELNTYDPPVYFLKDVDKSTGYKTKQMLAAPVFSGADSGEVIGVVQIINTKSGEPFPQSAEDGIVRLCKALTTAFQQGRTKYVTAKTKYDYLVINGVIAAAELDLAMRLARRKNSSLEQVLTEEFQVADSALGLSLSKFSGLPYEPFRPERVKPAALLRKLKRRFVESQAWVPIEEDDDGMVVITTNPEHVISSHIVNQVFPKKKVAYRVCGNREFAATVEQFFGEEGGPASVDTIIKRMERDTAYEGGDDVDEKIMPDSSTVQLVNRIVTEAHRMRASDIHIEPRQGRGKTKIRFRIDGALMDYTDVPPSYHAKIVARLKIMADLDISNRREPQDGKIKFKKFLPSLDVELRIATIPTAGGKEDVVIRILSAGKPVPLEELGLSLHNLQALKSIVSKPYGLFLVCGPTGSGKTTTLHSVLGYINTPETKIWTAEDPVEITDDSLRQVQINPRADLTFARAMRAFLRADPDVIMVGEMRDKETTAMGVEASLTGHRVLATLHTNSAPESIVRLLDMGMDPFNFADALLGIMAQRLARRLCAKCKKPYVGAQDEVKLMLSEYIEELKSTDKFQADPKASYEAIYADWAKSYAYEKGQFILYEPVGCEECRGTGYNGRIALHELLRGTDAIKKNVHEHARVVTILATAVNDGMRTLKQDGIKKVLEGHTNMHAVRAVCIK
jgi:type II secretory ATPase GspE/PulE/Tfp pilus assembly ATPase PilB-like protein